MHATLVPQHEGRPYETKLPRCVVTRPVTHTRLSVIVIYMKDGALNYFSPSLSASSPPLIPEARSSLFNGRRQSVIGAHWNAMATYFTVAGAELREVRPFALCSLHAGCSLQVTLCVYGAEPVAWCMHAHGSYGMHLL